MSSTKKLSDVSLDIVEKTKKNKKKKKAYQAAYIGKGGKLIKKGKLMTYKDAISYINKEMFNKSNRNLIWGVYAISRVFAKVLALGLGGKVRY